MKRPIDGVMVCPECGFDGAEVKRQKSGALLYRWCPECNAQYFPRTAEASERLAAKIKRAEPVTDTGGENEKEPVSVPEKAAPRRGGFDLGL